MKRLILGVAAALMLGAGPTAAEGLPSRGYVQDVAPVFSWTGFYVGAGVGAGAVVHDLTVSHYDHDFLNFDGVGGEGAFGTVIVGYDRQLRPGVVAGVFADYDFSGISTDLSFLGFDASLDHENSWSVGARLGLLSSPSTLWYATAGYTQAEFDFNSNFGDASLPTFDGYFVGGGVESMLRDNLSLRLEYRFSQFGDESILDTRCLTADLEPSMHSARLVLSYKFGHRN